MMAGRSTPEDLEKGPQEGGETAQAGSNSVGGHIPVLLPQVLEHLNLRAGTTVLDATFGAGGYTRAILEAADVRVIALDRDPAARTRADTFREQFGDRFIFAEGRFGELLSLAQSAGVDEVAGVVFDIGVSSMQLDQSARGFSFQADGPLDMRMSGEGRSARDLVMELPEAELAFLLKFYGEERRARAIARKICARRDEEPIETTFALRDIIQSVLGPPRVHKKHPATRSFQALRIAVNDELHELLRGLAGAERLLAPHGRLVVVDFHSLEDRIVKQFLRQRAGQKANSSRHLPEIEENFIKPSFQIINRRPVIPDESEMAQNPRARSARLRAAERLDTDAWPLEVDGFGLPRTLGT